MPSGALDAHRRHRLRRMLGATMLGVATVLVPKADARAHWSTSPVPTIEAPAEQTSRNPVLPERDVELRPVPAHVRPRRAATRWRRILRRWGLA